MKVIAEIIMKTHRHQLYAIDITYNSSIKIAISMIETPAVSG